MTMFILGQVPSVSGTPSGSSIWTSDDGVSWTDRASIFDAISGLSGQPSAHCFAQDSNGMILAGGSRTYADGPAAGTSTGKILAKSIDGGITWSEVSIPYDTPGVVGINGGNTNIVLSIWYSTERSLWMAVGQYRNSFGDVANPFVITSPDGVTWTAITPPDIDTNGAPWSVMFADGYWWISWGGYSGGHTLFKSNDDGASWSSVSNQFDDSSGVFRKLIKANGLYVGVGASGSAQQIETSSDGSIWTLRSSGMDSQIGFWVAYSTALSLWVGGSAFPPTLVTSPDGVTWTTRTSNLGFQCRGIASDDSGIIVAVGIRSSASPTHNTVTRSIDGVTWIGQGNIGDPTGNSAFNSGPMGVFAPSSSPPILTKSHWGRRI